jgi:hypothetical protein
MIDDYGVVQVSIALGRYEATKLETGVPTSAQKTTSCSIN